MKRFGKNTGILLATFFFMQLSIQLSAANTMKLSMHTVGANQQFTVRIGIDNANAFAAFQLDVPVPAGFAYLPNSAVLEASRTTSQSIQAEIVPGNILRIIGYSQNNALFLGDTGTIARFQLRSGNTPGTYPLTLVTPVIGDTNGHNILTGSLNGSVVIQAPDINITVTAIDFDRTPLGQSTTRSLTVFNNGNLPLNVTAISFTSPYFEVVGSQTFTITGGQNHQLTIKFNSVVRGQYNKLMTISSNDPDKGSWGIILSARAFAVNELHTGTMFAYSGKQASLTYSINNMDPFTGFQFDLQLPSPMAYVSGSASLLSRKTNHVVSANTLPGNKLRVVAYSATRQVFNGANGAVVTLTFNVNGTGGSYPLTLSNVVIGDTTSQNCLSDSYNGTLVVASPYISSASSLAFGDVSVLTFKQLPLRVYNNGTDTLKISSIQLTNPAFTLLTAFPLNILPNQNADLQLKFQQTVKGSYTGELKMFTNDPIRPIYKVSLSGTAYTPNYLTVPSLSTKNIDSLWVPVKVNNIEPFVGVQFDLEFPSFMQYIPASGQLTSRSQNHVITVQPLASNKIRVLAYSISQSPFTGDTGAIIRLRFAVNSVSEGQSSASLNLSGAILGNALMQNILYQSVNGNVTVHYPHILSGTVLYNNAVNTPMDSVWICLQQNGIRIDSMRTTTGGSFSFPKVYDGRYRVTGRTHKVWQGVNGTDALKIQRHFAGIELLTVPIRLTGADVNNSGSINGTDAVKVKRRFAVLDTAFARPDWIFEKTTGSDSVVMGTSPMSLTFYALCTGDVNGSNIPSTGAKSADAVEISGETSISAGSEEELYLPLNLDMEMPVGAVSMVLDFPPDLMQVEEVNFVSGQAITNVRSSKLYIVWSELNPMHIYPGEPFAFIKIKTTQQFSEGKRIELQKSDIPLEISDPTGTPLSGIKLYIPSVIYRGSQDEDMFSLYPNPARNYTALIFNSPGDGHVSLKVFDLNGKLVEQIIQKPVNSGLNINLLNTDKLIRGEYTVQVLLETADQVIKKVKKLIVAH